MVRVQDGPQSMRAALALSWTRDVVAVPYLREAAELDLLPTPEIEGLVRIGGPDAKAALEVLAKSSQPWTSVMARGALNRIK